MESISRFITQKLKLKVNEAKSAVARPQNESSSGSALRLVGHQAHDCAEIAGTVQATNPGHYAKGQGRQHQDDNGRTGHLYAGWRGYFRFCETPEVLIALTRWVDCDCGPLCGANGKPHGAAARPHAMGSQSGLQGHAGSAVGFFHWRHRAARSRSRTQRVRAISTSGVSQKSEIAAPAPHIGGQFFHCRLDADALGPSRNVPDSLLEPFSDFGAIVRLMSGPAVKLNPRNFRSCGRATALLPHLP